MIWGDIKDARNQIEQAAIYPSIVRTLKDARNQIERAAIYPSIVHTLKDAPSQLPRTLFPTIGHHGILRYHSRLEVGWTVTQEVQFRVRASTA